MTEFLVAEDNMGLRTQGSDSQAPEITFPPIVAIWFEVSKPRVIPSWMPKRDGLYLVLDKVYMMIGI